MPTIRHIALSRMESSDVRCKCDALASKPLLCCRLVAPSWANYKIALSSNETKDKILSMLTVVLSNYNHARFLPHALSALSAQTRPADEIILIDDASTDDSVTVIEAHLSRHPNIRLVRNPTNLGVIANLNRGLQMARGNKMYFAAADDIAYPALFEKSLALLDRYPRAALCSSRCDIIDSEGRSAPAMVVPMPGSLPGLLELSVC